MLKVETETQKYRSDCDRLSELEAVNRGISFGRWFLDGNYLCTWVCIPEVLEFPVRKLYPYEVNLDTLMREKEQFIQLISEKSWMGETGIKDLNKALKYITKNHIKLITEK